jgi:hypothetical protein
MSTGGSRGLPQTTLQTLVYELLDAHDDTARIAAELRADPVWSAHLEYLRTLQRRGREILAESALVHGHQHL